MKANTAESIKKRTKANDVFYTPINCVKKHMEIVSSCINADDVIYDPFYGTGNYYNTAKELFPKNVHRYTEIAMGLDFFDFNDKVDVIVSNPPYSILDKIFKKSIELKPHTISYLIGMHNLTTKRIETMNNAGYYLSKIVMLKVWEWFGMSFIVVFTNKTKTNCMEFDRTIYR